MADLNFDHAQKTAADLTATGVLALVIAEQWQGRNIDILANSAGIMQVHPLLGLPLDAWTKILAINVSGSLRPARHE